MPKTLSSHQENTSPTMMVKTLSTDHVSGIEDPRYLELMVSFYPRTVNYKNPSQIDLQAGNAQGLDTKNVSWCSGLADHE
jgi:hypothetical protein